MSNLNSFRQKSPQQRFLFILGVVMMIVYLVIGIIIIFFSSKLNIDPDKFPDTFRIAFGVLLIIYAIIRFSRLMNKKEIV